jgi:hypothetical protein
VTLPPIGLGAEVAHVLDDPELAGWCLERLGSAALEEMVVIPGAGRLVERLRGQCREVLGDMAGAVELATAALTVSTDIGLGDEAVRAEADLARLRLAVGAPPGIT